MCRHLEEARCHAWQFGHAEVGVLLGDEVGLFEIFGIAVEGQAALGLHFGALAVFDLEGEVVGRASDDDVHFLVGGGIAPVGDLGRVAIVVGVKVPQHGGFDDHAHVAGIGQHFFAAQEDGVAQRGVDQVVLVAGAQDFLAADGDRRQAVHEVGGAQQVEVIADGGGRGFQVARDGVVREDAAGVQAQVDEQALQVVDVAHAEQGGHVAFEHALDHVLAQQALAKGDVVLARRLREAAGEQIAIEQRQQGTQLRGDAQAIGVRGDEQIGEPLRGGKVWHGLVADVHEFVERERRHGDGDPAADAAFGEFFLVHHAGRAGGDDTVGRLVIDQEFDFGFPAAGVLDFVEQEQRGLSFRVDVGVVEGEDGAQAEQLEQRVVETEIKNALGVGPLVHEAFCELLQQRGFADAARAGQQDRAAQVRVVQIGAAGAVGKPPERRDGIGAPAPPGIESMEDIQDLGVIEKILHATAL